MDSFSSQQQGPVGRSWHRQYLPGLLFALALPAALYLATLYPGPGGRINVGDSAKFQYVGEILGVPHEPGYPQYVVLNFLFTRLPLPLELADRVNLLSALFSLTAAAFLFLALRKLTRLDLAAVLATWAVMLARSVWIFSTEAEVYSLHLLWVSALFWSVVGLLRAPPPRRGRWLAASIVILGASFGNHPTAALLVPGLAIIALGLDARLTLSRRILALAGLTLVLSLSQYAYLLWRSHSDAPFVEGIGRDASLADLVGKVSGTRFSSQHVLKGDSHRTLARLARAAEEIARQLTWPALILALTGAISLLAKDRLLLVYLLLCAILPPLFIGLYQIGDWQAYLAPSLLSLAALAAVGLSTGWLQPRPRRALAAAIWITALAWTIVGVWPQLSVEENPRDRSALFRAAEPGDWVVTYPVDGYSFRQLNNYYRYGLHLEERRGIRIRTAPEAFERDWAFLGDDRLLFATQDVRQVFDAHKTDYVQFWGASSASPVSATGTRFPTTTLRLLPAPGGRIRLLGPDETELTSADLPIQVVVVSPGEQRVKGVVSFPIGREQTRHSRWPLRDFLSRIVDGDWVVVVLQGEAFSRRSQSADLILDHFGIAPRVAGSRPKTLVFTGLSGDPPTATRILTDPSHPAELRVGGGP